MRTKKLKISLFALLVALSSTIIYATICQNFCLRDSYTIIRGGDLNSALPYFVSADSRYSLSAGTQGSLKSNQIRSANTHSDVNLLLFGAIPIKTASINTVDSPVVVPSGECIGVKLFCDGLIAVNITDFENIDGKRVSPAAKAGLKPGDIILEANGNRIFKIADFFYETAQKEILTLKVKRDQTTFDVKIAPQKCSDGKYRIGIVVRNSIAGIGTMTFLEKNSGKFAALGHGITDTDTGVIMPVSNGDVYLSSIIGVTKGKRGIPGEIMGTIDEDEQIGQCQKNLQTGIYGTTSETVEKDGVEIASRSEIQKGKASVICTVSDEGPMMYDAEIESISKMNAHGSKSMVIKITDRSLIDKTGGIVQGMSGSPIIQNGKLIGAITHVFVNDPTHGYAIFAETMLSELNGN